MNRRGDQAISTVSLDVHETFDLEAPNRFVRLQPNMDASACFDYRVFSLDLLHAEKFVIVVDRIEIQDH